MRIRSTTRKQDSQDATRARISRTKLVLCSRSAAGRCATVRIRRTAKRYLRISSATPSPVPLLPPPPHGAPPHKVSRCRRRSAGHRRPPAHPLPPALATGGAAREFARGRSRSATLPVGPPSRETGSSLGRVFKNSPSVHNRAVRGAARARLVATKARLVDKVNFSTISNYVNFSNSSRQYISSYIFTF
jgi:hypothetical protein